MERFFLYVKRFNTVVIAVGLLGILGLVAWGGAQAGREILRSEKKTIDVPRTGAETTEVKETFILRPTDFASNDGTPVFRLMLKGEGRSYEEGRSSDVRNLLFFRDGKENSKWLFPNQSQVLNRFESLKGDAGEEILYLETAPAKGDVKSDSKQGLRSVYLVRMSGEGLEKALSEVEMTLRHRVVKDQLEIIYQNSDAVRLAKYSLKNFQKLSDIEVARIESK